MNANPFTNPGLAGLYHLPAAVRDALPELAKKAGYRLLTADLRHCRDTAQALRELGKAALFPQWYGGNLDALADCLNDPDWRGEQATILTITGLPSLRRQTPDLLAPLIEILGTACRDQDSMPAPLWILLTDAVRGIAGLPGQ